MIIYNKMSKVVSVIFLTTIFWSSAFSESCITPEGKRSNCIYLDDCPELRKALEGPITGVIASYIKRSSCGRDAKGPKVCCGPLSVLTTTTTPATTGNEIMPEDSLPAPADQCGIDTNGDRIFGGEETELDEFPWMALLGYLNKNKKMYYKCGGALINQRYVLTAAHCVTGRVLSSVGELKTVRLGEYDIRTPIDCKNNTCADPVQEIPVHSAYPHEGFSDRDDSRHDDIALVRLARRATYSYYVKPICLPRTKTSLETGVDVYVAGWGKTLDLKPSNVKLKLELQIFDHDQCAKKYDDLLINVINKQVCAGGEEGKDPCRGDSGGPLMKRRNNGIWDVVGVISFGHYCGEEGWPGVYIFISSYDEWIRSKLRTTNK